jgi:acid stress-induced BolA-like protein IbaG/YrbA
VELREKVQEALRKALNPDHIHVEDDDGIWGYVVSGQFGGLPSLDRQMLIDRALRGAIPKLTKAELHRVLAIAPLTPAEYLGLPSRK